MGSRTNLKITLKKTDYNYIWISRIFIHAFNIFVYVYLKEYLVSLIKQNIWLATIPDTNYITNNYHSNWNIFFWRSKINPHKLTPKRIKLETLRRSTLPSPKPIPLGQPKWGSNWNILLNWNRLPTQGVFKKTSKVIQS